MYIYIYTVLYIHTPEFSTGESLFEDTLSRNRVVHHFLPITSAYHLPFNPFSGYSSSFCAKPYPLFIDLNFCLIVTQHFGWIKHHMLADWIVKFLKFVG